MYRKDMDKYKEKIRKVFKKSYEEDNGFSWDGLQELENEFEKIIQEIYEHGYSDGLEEKDIEESHREPIPWEDLD